MATMILQVREGKPNAFGGCELHNHTIEIENYSEVPRIGEHINSSLNGTVIAGKVVDVIRIFVDNDKKNVIVIVDTRSD